MNKRGVHRTRCLAFMLAMLFSLFIVACGGSIVDSNSDDEQGADPVVVEVPIAFIQRDFLSSDGPPLRDITQPAQFIPGASLVIKRRASASSSQIDLTQRLTALMLQSATGETVEVNEQAPIVDENGVPVLIDIKDLENDYSGQRIVFAARLPDLAEFDALGFSPTWDIYLYSRDDDSLIRVISSDAGAQAGDDTGPSFLADGRIVFSSTRQRGNQARLLDEGKPQYSGLEESLNVPASVLHLMDADGSDITQISYNQSHDLDPVVQPNGKILFSRWDQVSGDKGLNLYQMNADGSDLTLMYGRHSRDSVPGINAAQYSNTSVTPDGQILYGAASFSEPLFNTNYYSIDIQAFTDNERPIVGEVADGATQAQQSILFESISLSEEISKGGYINALYPLWDGSGRIIFGWAQCRLYKALAEGEDPSDPNLQRTIAPCSEENIANTIVDDENPNADMAAPESFELAPPVYGLWMFDPAQASDESALEQTQLALNIPQETVAISEVVAMENRPFPANPISSVDASNQQLLDNAYGVINIASVYDFDGEDSSPAGIVDTSNPLITPASMRPARFLRVVKSVSIPDDDVLEFDNSAFGRSQDQLMREVLGYTPIQPDGSVKVAVPANVPFTIEVLDAQGMRIYERHDNWLQLVPGEQKNCVGCHSQDSEAPHGRIEAQHDSINGGAPNTGAPFPGANPSLFADIGETMAQTFSRVQGLPSLTSDIVFEDIWANPQTQTPEPSFAYAYADLQTPLPVSQSCAQNWSAICRSVINYPLHIAPIFELDRATRDELGNVLNDNTCIACHSDTDADGQSRIPAAQLNLVNAPSTDDADVVTSYRELLFNDNAQELVDGALLDIVEPVLDENGDPVFATDENGELILDANGDPIVLVDGVNVPPSMRTQGALASERFFSPFLANDLDTTVNHAELLSAAELKLIAEWLDIGGQYYNNPFDAPQD
ncbi:hypothetical protein PN836_013035 [Ningiella sp. W23]|uniref:HzsA-related protein n=1 Tax=Ningiella sp. W23 TaxID=3023715 RepID=UPI003757F21E